MARPTFLTNTLGDARKPMRLLFVLSFLANILLLVSSIYMMQVFDRVLSSGSLDTLLWLSVSAVVAATGTAVAPMSRKNITSPTPFS